MKKVLISILTIVFIMSMAITVNAATGSISLSTSSETVIKGKTFTVTLAGTADQNISGLESALSFDTNKLSIEGKSAGGNFTDASGSNSEINVLSTGSTLEKTGTLYNITFKVLDSAEVGDTTIKVSGATLALVNESSVQENTAVTETSVTVKIKADDTTVGTDTSNNTTDEPSNSSSADKDNSSNSGSSSSGNNTNASKKTTKLPQTGVEITSPLAIVSLSVISVISYVSYRKYKNVD